jgi:hypothetical protein
MPNGEIKSTPAYYPPTPSRKKSNVFLIGILVIVLAILGVGITLATRLWDPLWNPFRPEPEEVIEKMSTEMGGLKTIHSRTKIDMSSREEAKEVFKLSLDFTNDLDKTDSQNPKSAGEFYLNFEAEEIGIAFGGEGKTIGKDFYLKLTIVPSIPESPINVNQLKDQWIKIDEESIRNLLESSGAPIDTSEIEKAKEKQKEILQRFQTLIKGKKLYIVKKEFPDEKIGNLKTYHYLVALNKEEIKKLIPELLKELIKTGIFPQPPTETEWQEFEKEFPKKFDEFFAKIGDIEGEIWIGKKDLYLYEIKGEKEIDLSKFEEGAKGKITAKLDTDFSNFNQPLKIETPTEFKTLEEIFVLSRIISESLLESQSKAKDARIMADISQARTIAEMIYDDNNSYEDLCSEPPVSVFNKKAPNYGTILKTIEEDIKIQQGGFVLLDCLDSTTSYCIQVRLNSPDKEEYCIDSAGIAKFIDKNQKCIGAGTSKNPYRCP